MAITTTTLNNPKTLERLGEALHKVTVQGHSVAHVRNRKGDAFLAVRYFPATKNQVYRLTNFIGRKLPTPLSSYWIVDKQERDVTDVVLSALRRYGDPQHAIQPKGVNA